MLIRQQKYFVLHAPRQTGKTSCLLALRDYLNTKGEYYAVYANIEAGQAYREQVEKVNNLCMSVIAREAKTLFKDAQAEDIAAAVRAEEGDNLLATFLSRWCETLDRLLILLIDEIDALVGDSLVSILRQIRSGYANRPARSIPTIVSTWKNFSSTSNSFSVKMRIRG